MAKNVPFSAASLLVALFAVFSPFTFGYLYKVGGVLVRPTDICLILLMILTLLRGNLLRLPWLPYAALAIISFLLAVRVIAYSDAGAAVAFFKYVFFIAGSACLANVIGRSGGGREFNLAASIFVVVLVPYVLRLLPELSLVFGSTDISSATARLWHFWNSAFKLNPFGSVGLEVQGISFRNTMGLGALSAALLSRMTIGVPRYVTGAFIVFSALSMSRSVWLLLCIWMLVTILHGRGKKLFFQTLVLVAVAGFLINSSDVYQAIADRLATNGTRGSQLGVAIDAIDNLVIGSKDGAQITLGSEKLLVHNIPLALLLEVGVAGFLASILLQLWAALWAIRFALTPGKEIACVAATAILLRPLVSPSVDTYFSIGGWMCFAIVVAEVSKMRNMARISPRYMSESLPPAGAEVP